MNPLVNVKRFPKPGEARFEAEDPVIQTVSAAEDKSLLARFVRPTNQSPEHRVRGAHMVECGVGSTVQSKRVVVVMQAESYGNNLIAVFGENKSGVFGQFLAKPPEDFVREIIAGLRLVSFHGMAVNPVELADMVVTRSGNNLDAFPL
jgi:hypothetical protein